MNQTQSPSRPVTTPLERPKPLAKMEAALNGKFFMFVFRQGTRFRSGRIIEVITDQFIKVRYFSLKTRELMSFEHMVKLYAEPSVEDLTGWFLFESLPSMDQAYPFFSEHFKRQEKQNHETSS